ncbi:MAG: OsmC family protein [Gammaproteobacteria bacterium]|nr:OsmC family protein [Gammaproteobacteria bacterium]MDH3468510.1 OsmC family protein [Gammaproteobacteria bacterium]
MDPLPHVYTTSISAGAEGDATITSAALPEIVSAPPAEFGGLGNRWSPEQLLVASVAACLVMSFRAIARASRLTWVDIDCRAEGVLERVEGKTLFTRFTVHAKLRVPPNTDTAKAEKLLEKAEDSCFISNSLSADCELNIAIETV